MDVPAADGDTGATNNLGNVLARSDPPDLAAARGLWERAAAAGDTGAMANLGDLLAQPHPPEPATARAWLEKGRGIRGVRMP